MKLEFTKVAMKLANVNVRSELHGDEREPASDLKFEAMVSNDVLSQLDGGLKSALYHYDSARPDLVDEGKKGEPGFLPHLRFPRLGQEGFKWNDEMAGASVSILVKGAKKPLELKDVKVNNLKLSPKDGGTVALALRVQCHPDEDAFGKLATLVQSEVEVTIVPAAE